MTPFDHSAARTAVESYLSCEQTLAGVLRVVPWCDEHKSVWSPALCTVIMEACTQLDSLWRFTAWHSTCVQQSKKRKDLSIHDYFRYFANQSLTPLADRWVVFWGGEPTQMRPFVRWGNAKTYTDLAWWLTYNKLKHDRLEHRKMATLEAAVEATAGLFLGILSCEYCRYAVEAAGWLSARDSVSHNPKASLGEDSPSVKDDYVLAETALFSYPVGWCKATISKTDDWLGNASFRFKHWFWEFATS